MGVRPVVFRIIAGGASPEHSSMDQPGKSRLTSPLIQLQQPQLAAVVATGLRQEWEETPETIILHLCICSGLLLANSWGHNPVKSAGEILGGGVGYWLCQW